ncbi:MAG: hypothetical protein H6R09_1427 [Proteobacteria bacterium]|nr:hypothetical protein [Pseudomonadota bacterium]
MKQDDKCINIGRPQPQFTYRRTRPWLPKNLPSPLKIHE